MTYLILVRHGESRWNAEKRFTGWIDVPLTQKGIDEALQTATELEGYSLDVAFTSNLHRARETLLLILSHQQYTGIFQHSSERHHDRYAHQPYSRTQEIPLFTSDLLNERYYGSLQGMKKSVAARTYGKKQVFAWRRGWDDKPPGNGESIKETYRRTLRYVQQHIFPQLEDGKNVLLVGHGTCLRTIVKYIEEIPDEKIPFVELPNAQPIIYKRSRSGFIRINESLSYTRPLR